jgi:hypothetical protein
MTENGLQTFVMGLYRAGQAGQCSHAQRAARNMCKHCPNFVKTLSALTTNAAQITPLIQICALHQSAAMMPPICTSG